MKLAKKRGRAICNDLFWRFWLSFELPLWVHTTLLAPWLQHMEGNANLTRAAIFWVILRLQTKQPSTREFGFSLGNDPHDMSKLSREVDNVILAFFMVTYGHKLG